MSRENVESFKRMVEAWNRDDFDAWIDQFDPKVEWSTLVEVYRGHAGARQAWENLKGSQHPSVRIDDFRDLGETVLTLGEVMTVGQTTRLSFSDELAQLATYRRGKLVTLRDFPSHAEGLEGRRPVGVASGPQEGMKPAHSEFEMSEAGVSNETGTAERPTPPPPTHAA
jgi:hypothetical protein